MVKQKTSRRKLVVSSADEHTSQSSTHVSNNEPAKPPPSRATRTTTRALRSQTKQKEPSGPPLKQKKQTTIIFSDDEEPAEPAEKSKRATSKLLSPTSSTKNARPSSQTQRSPSKKKVDKPKAREKSIYSFFNAATQRLQSKQSVSPEKPSAAVKFEDEEDLIEDDSLGEEMAELAGNTESKSSLAIREKRKHGGLDDYGVTARFPLGSQKYMRTSNGSKRAVSTSSQTSAATSDPRPWTEKYGPVDITELAVHKKKVDDVRDWLVSVFTAKYRKKLLVLKGAAGTGKTTTLNILSTELGFDVSEWKNPTTTTGSDIPFTSVLSQFEDFIARTGAFGSLEFASAGPPKLPEQSTDGDGKRTAILMEEFPNVFTKSTSGVQSFRNIIKQYLSANVPPLTNLFGSKAGAASVTPLVMIISETLVSTSTASIDSFTAHRLLGPEVLSHPCVTIYEFNPVAPTILSKALDLALRKDQKTSQRLKGPGPAVIKYLSETGDVRNAISTLEFLCLRGSNDVGWGDKMGAAKQTKAASKTPHTMTDMEKSSLEIVTQRESALGIFHAVGKIIYNKRDAPNAPVPPQPPSHLPQFARTKPSEVNVDTLIDELGTDIQTFVAAIHENYILSCNGATSEDTLDSINGCIDALSDADLLSPDRFGNANSSSRRSFQGSGADTLRQDEMCFHVAARGVLFEMPYPVKRISPPQSVMKGRAYGGNSRVANMMFYPMSLRLWRKREEIEGMIDLFVSRAQRGLLGGVAAMENASSTTAVAPRPKFAAVDTWRKAAMAITPPASQKARPGNPANEDQPPTVLLGSGGSASNEMLLERLPYMTAMLRRKAASKGALFKEMESVTRFTGVTMVGDEVVDDDDGDDEADNIGKKKTKDMFGQKGGSNGSGSGLGASTNEVASLVLSDDDIED
ncbi:Rad17-domain-containing protein [Aulographum hederae CBS 113979]|uniref:Rad17-domain-containing protein n=1 Tax=Aulographum hederae CBS 113979 TaxID=1176131 RepID=A0A6G1HHV3_9PEZI|nr:Rad17-domain-containing protein [Aulographum hederae CBS 113979]